MTRGTFTRGKTEIPTKAKDVCRVCTSTAMCPQNKIIVLSFDDDNNLVKIDPLVKQQTTTASLEDNNQRHEVLSLDLEGRFVHGC